MAFGGFLGFLTGWFEWLSNLFYAALSSIGFAYVVAYLLPGLNIPLTAVIIVILFAFINLRGTKATATAESIITIVVLVLIALFVIGGWSYTLGSKIPLTSSPLGLIGIFSATALSI